MRPTPADESSGWLLGEVATFDMVADLADLAIALLAGSARDGDTAPLAEIAEVRQQVRSVDGRDPDALAALQARLAGRVEELTR